ncbi:MAG: DUF2868 domain-containing protein [Candidatus Scalindua sp. SCAELEC01]|nr:DUF2868 domain-containing protein [Planctomycetota bacterium]RZV61721.1 MAG: DUF2868 domain-containing protein [Candidatus Scalindua sp. SCAELEC01]
MNEYDARRVLFVRAIEKGDSAGLVLPKADRLVATRKAERPQIVISEVKATSRPLNQKEESFFLRRAELLIQILKKSFPDTRIDLREMQWKGWLTALFFVLALFFGFIANEFESGKRLNLLAFPMMGMLIWNFAVYGYIGISYISSTCKKKSTVTFNGPIIRALSSMATRQLQRNRGTSDRASILNRCFHDFTLEWYRLSSIIYKHHAARVMHVCAVLFAVGIIGGMYMRGVTTEYYAGWESTFLEAETVQKLMNVVFMPAALVTGQQLPTLERIKAIQWRDRRVGENAAEWIHLFSKTLFLFIVLPRGALFFIAFKRERKFRAHFPIPSVEDPYFRELLTARPGQKEHILVIPYTIELADKQMEVLRSLFDQSFGWKTQTEFHDSIPYGGENKLFTEVVAHAKASADYLIILFNLSSTPEDEIHGAFIHSLKEAIANCGSTKYVLVTIDESHFVSRFSRQMNGKERLELRKKLWEKTVARDTIRPIFVDLHNPDVDDWRLNISQVLTSLKDDAKRYE